MEFNTWFGTLEIGNDGKILYFALFSGTVREFAARSLTLRENRQLLPPAGFDLRAAALECGFVNSQEEYNSCLHAVTLETVKLQLSASLTPDQRIIQAVEALDDLNEAINPLSERLSEWYGGYFPETGLAGEALALFVAKYGSRENVGPENPLYAKALESVGAKFETEDEVLLKGFAENLCRLYEQRKKTEAYIESRMLSRAPNLTTVAGAGLGARLISIAGSLEKLALFPSSTIQVIGANRALFKHLRARAPSPKHGVIYSHPLLNTSPWWLRGKIARALAAKLSLAARMDFYSGRKDPALLEELEKKVQQIRASNPRPPQKKKNKNEEKSKKEGQRKCQR